MRLISSKIAFRFLVAPFFFLGVVAAQRRRNGSTVGGLGRSGGKDGWIEERVQRRSGKVSGIHIRAYLPTVVMDDES